MLLLSSFLGGSDIPIVMTPPQARASVYHLALLAKPYLRAVLSGDKSVEARLTRNRIVPFGAVQRGDVVYLKAVSGGVEGVARVAGVREFTQLTPAKICELEGEYKGRVGAPGSFWAARARARYAVFITLARIEDVRADGLDWRAAVPRGSRSGWHVLSGPLGTGEESLADLALRATG